MSRLLLATRHHSGLLLNRRGSAAVSFALVVPLLALIGFALVEFSLLAYDYHRAGEATRRGGRVASILDPIAEISVLSPSVSVVCSWASATVSCTNTTVRAPANFDTILADIQEVLPEAKPENVEVEYRYSGLGDLSTPGGILPLVTVRLTDVTHDFGMLTMVPGMPATVTLPPFATTHLAGGYKPS